MNRNATWIWYPGDFEVWLGARFNNRRTERGAMLPPFWKQDAHWPLVVFRCRCRLSSAETVRIAAEGHYSLQADGRLLPGQPVELTLDAGAHELVARVWNQASPPALFVEGDTLVSGPHWEATCEDKIWIDEQGQAHGSGVYVPAASWRFNKADTPPSTFRLERKELSPVGKEAVSEKAVLYDFGEETFGYLKFHLLKGTVRVYYGESREEALDKEHCETLDVLSNPLCCDSVEAASKAFRYVCIEADDGAAYASVAADHEYAPFDPAQSGSFHSSDDELNRIWQVAARTLDLTTREFFCDGIKRDRWVWSGDAIQSYLMNYYLRFDTACVKRTIRQLRGKDPVTTHVNTIMDYTFYWFKSIADYYDYTGDMAFVVEMWPKMVTLMDYVLQRATGKCLAEARPGDWIFVDWTDFPMGKHGVLAFEQILFWKALKTMETCGRLLGHGQEADTYAALAKKVKHVTEHSLYSYRYEAYGHALEAPAPPEVPEAPEVLEGIRYRVDNTVTRFPNIFAIIYDFCGDETKRKLLEGVLLNPSVPPITTPYMRFYELEALCQMGRQADVLHQLKDYWGGMLRLGATTFWEKYNPGEQGAEHLAMYGRPYGKSLCHSWGASPLYILGRYFLGVRPTEPGYARYEVRPVLGGLRWMAGDVPTPFGKIHVEVDADTVTVGSDGGEGTLIVGDRHIQIPPGKKITEKFAVTTNNA